MPVRIYSFTDLVDGTVEKKIEKVIEDENVALNHMIIPQGAEVPEHYSNSNVYLIIAGGTMTIALDDKDPAKYSQGKILNIPYHTKMHIRNKDEKTLEFFIVKSPHPRDYPEK